MIWSKDPVIQQIILYLCEDVDASSEGDTIKMPIVCLKLLCLELILFFLRATQ